MLKTKQFMATIILAALTLSILSQTGITQAATELPTYLQVTAEPNPVGVGQVVYISLFFTKPIPTITVQTTNAQVYKALTVNLIKPDGTNTTFGPYDCDTTGGVGGIEFTPETTGNYTVQAIYPGQTLTTGEILLPDISDSITFTVQDEAITGYTTPALPTEYWSRPIYSTNYAWSSIGGNWWGLGKPSFTDTGGYDATGNNFNAYSEAPTSAHIMWVKATSLGGQVGGPISGDQESQYTSTSILYRQFEPVILNGVIYYKVYSNTPTTYSSSETPGWNAIDLRTGELLWHKDTNDTLDFAVTLQFHTIQEYGTQAWLVGACSSSVWQLFDPTTGYFVANITNVPSTTASGLVEDKDDNSQGAVYIYSINNGNLTMWNSTLCIQGPVTGNMGPTGTDLTIRPSGNINYSRGYQWSVPINTTYNGNPISLSIAARTLDGILLQYAPTLTTQTSAGWTIEAGYDARTGELLWGPVNRTVPIYGDMSMIAAGEGYYVTHNKDTNEAYGFDITTGDQLWGPVQLDGSALSTMSRGGAIAYGKCYIWDFGGYVNAIDLETGKIAWTYTPTSAGYDTPYGVYPIWHFGTHSIADNLLFLSEGRMYDPPLFAGAQKLAINCTTGELIWSVLGTYAREPSAIADGYMVGYNSYDAQIYVFGKGPSQTTAEVRNNIVTSGSSVLITGTVLDIASGTTDSDRSARFPNGVACVSDESQSAWMEYVYMQQEQPTNATGVNVELYVLDSNGNYRSIGTATTDTNGYYSYQWTPDITGKYTVYAVFSGTNSYYSSQATAAFAVDEPAATATAAPTQAPSAADLYFIPAIAGIILAIVIVGVLTILMLRKRP
jgi:PQQ enzyme repeat.